jgi:hypothetical protein
MPYSGRFLVVVVITKVVIAANNQWRLFGRETKDA